MEGRSWEGGQVKTCQSPNLQQPLLLPPPKAEPLKHQRGQNLPLGSERRLPLAPLGRVGRMRRSWWGQGAYLSLTAENE